MATVILGGLLSSTLLDIIVTPVVFHQFGKQALETYFKNKNIGLSHSGNFSANDSQTNAAPFAGPVLTEQR